ncbi:MAG: lipid A export permease/ATP-binding protein MsbA [Alphaproteobacteria bacterium]|nr:lipid A export permease/ATP-binding protein MsbA [Alphaproteobacteria bacterium]
MGKADSSQGGRTRTRILVKRLFGEHIRPHIGLLLLAVSLMAVVAATTAALAFLMETILDDVFTARDRSSLYTAAAIVMAVFLLKGMATYGQNVLVSFVGQRILADLQKRMFAHLLRADLAYFHDQSSGGLISRFINDVEKMRGTVASVFTAIGRDSLTIIFLVAVMFYQDWLLAVASFFAFPTAILPLVNIGKRMRKVSANTQRELGQFTTLLNEVFQGARHVKAYGMEAYERKRADTVIEQIFSLVFRAARTKAAAYPIMETLGGTAIVVVICYGGWQVIEGTRSTGTFFSFVTALLLAYDPVKKLVNLNAQLQEGLAAADRVFEILDVEPAILDRPDAKEMEVAKGDIEFADVTFGYGDGPPALRGVSFAVEAGKTVALVGQSGAGKSTVLNLIPRFFDTNSGRISVDGHDIRDLTIASLRANIALVSQDVTLFDDTIEANIAYGRAGATPEEVREAARNASAHAFIEEMPEGYATVVGEHGVKLSGGQRQRVAIARAMLKDAPILLLDEATSALDTESERAVQAALGILMEGRTTIVIAHRLSTIQSADMIHVVDAGRIVESGRHLELLARDGVYANLHRLQFSDADGAAIERLSQVGG